METEGLNKIIYSEQLFCQFDSVVGYGKIQSLRVDVQGKAATPEDVLVLAESGRQTVEFLSKDGLLEGTGRKFVAAVRDGQTAFKPILDHKDAGPSGIGSVGIEDQATSSIIVKKGKQGKVVHLLLELIEVGLMQRSPFKWLAGRSERMQRANDILIIRDKRSYHVGQT